MKDIIGGNYACITKWPSFLCLHLASTHSPWPHVTTTLQAQIVRDNNKCIIIQQQSLAGSECSVLHKDSP